MSVIRSFIALLIVGVLVVIGATYMQISQTVTQQVARQTAQRATQTYTVKRGNVQSTVSALGSVEAAETSEAAFKTSGQVTKVLVETGDYVYKGQALAQLDNTTQTIAYQQAKLNLEKANLAMQDVLSQPSEDDVKIAKASLASAQASYSSQANSTTAEELQAAQLKYDSALQTYQDAQRQRQVSGGLNDNQIAELDARIGSLSFSAELARLSLDTLKKGDPTALSQAGARIAEAQANLNQLLAGPTQSDINSAQVTLDTAESNLRNAETNLNRTTLTSSVDGLVMTVSVQAGQTVNSGTTVMEISNSASLRMAAAVNETDVLSVTDGMNAYVQLDALSEQKIPASVTSIDYLGTDSDNVVTYNTTLSLNTADPRVRVGMTGEAFFITKEQDNVLMVPNTYLRTDATGKTTVTLVRAGRTSVVDVQTGLQGDDDTEIVSGLNEGDVISSASTTTATTTTGASSTGGGFAAPAGGTPAAGGAGPAG